MTKIRAVHQFFPVGQGLFAAGSVEFWPPEPKPYRLIEIEWNEQTSPLLPYRWVYNCGSSTSKRLVANAITNLKGDCSGEKIK